MAPQKEKSRCQRNFLTILDPKMTYQPDAECANELAHREFFIYAWLS